MEISECELGDLADLVLLEANNLKAPWDQEALKNEFENDLAYLYKLTNDGEIIGYVDFWIIFERLDLNRIVIKADYRQRGLGQKLFNKVVEVAKAKQVEYLFLEVRATNFPALKFYGKLGFINLRTRVKYYGDDDAYEMVKAL